MKVLITGSAGRIGRHIYVQLMAQHEVVGFDRSPCSTTDVVGDLRDRALLDKALIGVEVLIHCAALHAPQLGHCSDDEFTDINVQATEQLLQLAAKHQVAHIIYTSTTALYGEASTPTGRAGWINEATLPQPKTIYHRSKVAAEQRLQQFAVAQGLPVTVLRIGRCFPEAADKMAVYRLHRGIDARDVASAHCCALNQRLSGFNCFIISAPTPFRQRHCQQLFEGADQLITELEPQLAAEFARRGWLLPRRIDRVYDSSLAQQRLGWRPRYGYQGVLDLLDEHIAEVLPVRRCERH
ncbi:NAD(P)-dependent oxidoreductase [uncultured Ferrimonas sp.]|uniref:NAD-dependent epimerase/dehydratase family protein n=1 Tax=uncultured Ferrimonas sp. TaxID=432640 RepID=UPI00261AD927|nr:NAD(P)-dependent oxidoreductase [uncultured Ferrimonas sp.]